MFPNKTCLILLLLTSHTTPTNTLDKRALQKSHEKTQTEKWSEAFFGKKQHFNQVPSLVALLGKIAEEYLSDCFTIILYDEVVAESDDLLLQELLRKFPHEYRHGSITNHYEVQQKDILTGSKKCVNYIMFMADVMRCVKVIGQQIDRKVVIVARSSQWRVHEFLSSEVSHNFVNLLVISKSEKIVPIGQELPYILYTHQLYVDGLGSSVPYVVTSWMKNNITRYQKSLFPDKIKHGFAGHRFIISLSVQPPYVIKRGTDDNDDNKKWDGIEIRLVQLLAKMYNFTTDFRESSNDDMLGSSEMVVRDVVKGRANIGISGAYMTAEKTDGVDLSHYHSVDCAAFASLTSTALPRYRAIMGPFHWTVWLALTIVYLLAIFPLTFSDKHTLSNLIESPEEMENMFWYVFGTFTNCFSFMDKRSWSKSDKMATRLLIGFYWLFTIIVTACYTGSIIAFVTLPVYPETVDTIDQLLSGRYQIGVLDKGGWEYWYNNITDAKAAKLLKRVDLVPTIEAGLKNTTKAFFWPYALLASRSQLDYIIRTNFSTTSKRSLLHISSECFATYSVGMIFPKNSLFRHVIDTGILSAVGSGFISKLTHDVEWDMMRSATGKLLQASAGNGLKILAAEDRALTLDDTQGMFLLLGAGFLAGAASLFSEIVGGCFKCCKKIKKTGERRDSIDSNPRCHSELTPREKLNSMQDGDNVRNYLISVGGRMSEDSVRCEVHVNSGGDREVELERENSYDYEQEIDRLFDVFGEVNENGNEEVRQEEIIEQNDKLVHDRN